MKDSAMPSPLYFFVSVLFSLIAWGIVAARYIWPRLRVLQRADALRPILILHCFRFVGLAFMVQGVVSPELSSGFTHPAAFGDIAAALLALLALATLETNAGVTIAWAFNLWGTFDLLSAFYHGGQVNLVPGQLGATYFIPTVLVPLMLITHMLAFRILLRRKGQPATTESYAH
jgi:hypothetical protein